MPPNRRPATSQKRTNALYNNLANTFATLFGLTTTKLSSLQSLCQTCGITSIPLSITQCKKVLKSRTLNVNIYDLIDAKSNGTTVSPELIFPTTKALARYSKNNNKIFPKRYAKADTLLASMLRKIL